MIINAAKSNVKVLGDIKEFKTSIDPKNLEFITTLLSSNLYSDPEQSFIREIVSNAWDSHIEAGTTNIPIIIKFTKETNYKYSISVRDFGTGLSPERFQTIFCNIGSSTKRESNDYIGAFGIGRYSALSCSNTVYITSYYNGTAYFYVMTKSGNCITTNLVLEKSTEEKNGVEVTIKNIYNLDPYRKALRCITFFPNVYIDGIDNKINTTKVKKFNNFAVASCRVYSKILLGNVLYPCNESLLSSTSRKFLNNIAYTGIVLKFNIGDLSITPNRESIIYSSDTVAKIEQKINDAREELDNMVIQKYCKDYTDLYEYYSTVKSSIRFNPLENISTLVSSDYSCDNGYYTSVNSDSITFKGTKLNKAAVNVIIQFFHTKYPNIKGVFHNGKYYTSSIPINAYGKLKVKYKKIVCLTGTTRLTSVIKEWLKTNYPDYTIVTSFTKEEFRSYIIRIILSLSSSEVATVRETLIESMYDYIISNITYVDINTDSNFLEYKKSIEEVKTPTIKTINPIIYVYNNNYTSYMYRTKRSFNDIESCVKCIKDLKKGVILTDMQDSDDWYYIATARNFAFIRARKDIVKAIRELNPSFLVDKEWVLTKDPTIIKLHTIIKCLDGKKCPTVYSAKNMLKIIPESLKKEFIDIMNLNYKFSSSVYRSIAETKCTAIDGYTEYMCNKLIKYNDIYNKTCLDIELEDYNVNSFTELLVAAVIMKNKSFRINPKVYEKVKNNKFLKILCRK